MKRRDFLLGAAAAAATCLTGGIPAFLEPTPQLLGSVTTPIVLTRANIVDYIVQLGKILDEQDIPKGPRYVNVPVWWALELGIDVPENVPDVCISL